MVIIPIRAQIAKPELYILRRGLKEAIEQKVDTIVLDMETPGGALDVTFEMLKALEKFPGKTVTYVNREAISAGALISAGTDEIYFAPGGVIGAAAPVIATGGEIDETMRDKIVSYLKARVRSISEGKGYRGEVISAMIDTDSELKIGDDVIKQKGELLSLTAQEAIKLYGDPPQPLLGAGIAENIDDLLDQLHGAGNHTVIRLEVTWSEQLAQYLTALTPLLLGRRTALPVHRVQDAGLRHLRRLGHSAVRRRVLRSLHRRACPATNRCCFSCWASRWWPSSCSSSPARWFLALTGAALMLGSLVWAMLDLWPGEPVSFSGDVLLRPLANVHGRRGDRGGALPRDSQVPAQRRPVGRHGAGNRRRRRTRRRSARSTPSARTHPHGADLIGQSGVAATALFPSGQVEISGRRYEAKLAMGFAEAGTPVTVTGVSEFGLIVEVLS